MIVTNLRITVFAFALAACIGVAQASDAYSIRTRANWTEEGRIELQVFMKQRVQEAAEFSMVLGSRLLCTGNDGEPQEVTVSKFDDWGNIDFSVQRGLLFSNRWHNRSMILKPLEGVLNRACRGEVLIEIETDESRIETSEPFEVPAENTQHFSNPFDISESIASVTLEIDEYSRSNRAFVKFVFTNDSANSVSIKPESKFISCPRGNLGERPPVVWDVYGPSPRGGMHRIYIPPGELGALTDVIGFSIESSWRNCSLTFVFSDGQSSLLTSVVDLDDVATGFVRKSK